MGWLAVSLLRLAINSPLHSFQKNRNPGKPMPFGYSGSSRIYLFFFIFHE